MSLNEFVVILGTLIGAIAAGYLQQRKQNRRVSADLDAHKRTVAASAKAHAETLTEELARRHADELETVKAELTERVATQQASIEFLSRCVTTLTEDLTTERERNRELENALHQRKEEIALLQKQVGALEDVIREMREQRDRSIEALGTALEREKSMHARIETLERELGELKIKNIQLEAELRAYKSIVEPFFAMVAGAFKPPPATAEPMPLEPAA